MESKQTFNDYISVLALFHISNNLLTHLRYFLFLIRNDAVDPFPLLFLVEILKLILRMK